jgi:hypothetical protein
MINSVYLHKRDGGQAFWEWAQVASPAALAFVPVKLLVDTKRVLVSEPYARRVLDWLRVEHEMYDGSPYGCPIVVRDYFGEPVPLN